jgi:hypothetical protein
MSCLEVALGVRSAACDGHYVIEYWCSQVRNCGVAIDWVAADVACPLVPLVDPPSRYMLA